MAQYIIVILILAVVGYFTIRKIVKMFQGKNKGCNCGSCCANGKCHCKD
ncbi:MAG: FeoB-associated Cys-rich membrane protein [Bacteroidales bacterium]|nr:FeoB-associated Cys-rich membrane protein [Bacteroidales bacterium]MBQ9313308.1 FeoB-associated Cys-rich membrane protein [Bacteroidales bacterium]